MQKKLILIMVVLLAAITTTFAQNAADFTVDANGLITKYAGWDTEVVIPATIGGKKITAIGNAAFQKADLTSVTIPDSVTSIGKSAFAGNKLTSITVPGSVKTIGEDAFKDNVALTTVVLNEGVETVEMGAFSNTKCQSFSIPASIVSMFGLEKGAYDKWPEPLTYILAANLRNFSALPYAVYCNYIANNRQAGTYTSNMTCIKKRADDHTYVETQYGAVLTEYNGYTGDATRLRIPAEIGGVAVNALSFDYHNYSKMVTVQIPAGIIYIESGTFSNGNDGNLENVDIPASVTYIGNSAFMGCKLKTVTIPENVVDIGSGAFANCQLTSVTFSAQGALKTIGASAFSGNKLTAVAIPASIVHIEAQVFSNNSLTSITIPASVVSIGVGAFLNNGLTSVNIPASVTYLGNDAFSGNSLKTITIPPSVKVLGDNLIRARAGYGEYFYAPGTSIVIGANVSVGESDFSFGKSYNRNGRKAGRYTFTASGYGGGEWVYSAR